MKNPQSELHPVLKRLRIPPDAQILFPDGLKEPPAAPSEPFELDTRHQRKLRMRRWYTPEGCPNTNPATQAVVLLVHGLGGRTEWMSPLAMKLLETSPHVYGLDLPQYGEHPTGVGRISTHGELVNDVRDTVQWLKDQHGKKVFLIGLSLGGLVTTHMAALYPENLGGLCVISPAYRAAQECFNPLLYLRVIGQFYLEKARCFPEKTIPLPYSKDEDLRVITRNPEKIRLMREAQSRILELTSHSYMELLKMTVFATPARVKQIHVPVLMFIAGRDTVCDRAAMTECFEKIPSKDKRMVVFPDAYHDLVFEPEMPAMAEIMEKWIQERG